MRTFMISSGCVLMRAKEINPKISNIKVAFLMALKFCLLAIAIFLFGGNENANPRVGNSSIEFYSSSMRQSLYSELSDNLKNDTSDNNMILVNKFYVQRQHMPAWTINFRTNEAYSDLINLIESSGSYGLFSSMFSHDELIRFKNEMETLKNEDSKLKARIKLEMLASESAFEFMTNISAGIIDSDLDSAFTALTSKYPIYLNYSINSNKVRENIIKLQPQSEQYIFLQTALVKFIKNVELNELEYSIDNFINISGLTQKVLIDKGYLDKKFMNDSIALVTAIINYQKFNSLEPTGIADDKTLNVLGRSTNELFKQIALNLDRLRKDELKKENYILVNIPEFALYYFDEEGIKNEFNIVVGKENSPTPILTSRVEHIITNPHWTVPNSIVANEIIPKLQTDSTYLLRHGFKVVDKDAKPIDEATLDLKNIDSKSFQYYFRQDIGEKNSLGLVKFLFPNKHSVYLHDTPSKQYFRKNIRAFSHGCIRVENPEKLAQMLIKSHSAKKDLIFENLIKSKKQIAIKMEDPVPIYIKYYTCTADSNANIYFHHDIYSYDTEAIQQIFAGIGQGQLTRNLQGTLLMGSK